MRRRRLVQVAPLTSLLDVLFILVFASLIHGAGLEAREREREAAEREAERDRAEREAAAREAERDRAERTAQAIEPPAPAASAALRQLALAELAAGLERRRPVVARISPDGRLRELEHRDGRRASRTSLGITLLERVPDPDIALSYLGERSSDLRLCNLVRLELGAPDLSEHLVIIAPDAPLDRLSVALALGLRRDAERCASDQRGVAVVVDPTAPPSEETAP